MSVNRISLVVAFSFGLIIGGGYFYLTKQQVINENEAQISVLQEEYITLQTRFTTLEETSSVEISDLKEDLNELTAEYVQLDNQYASLESDHNTLVLQYSSLQTNHERTLAAHSTLEYQYEQLDAFTSSYQDSYQNLIHEVNLRLAFNENFPTFVTPNDPEIEYLVYQLTSGWENKEDVNELWDDRKTIFDWVTSNIEYAADSPYPYLPSSPAMKLYWSKQSTRFPNETIDHGTGDCEDQAALLLSLIISHDEGRYPNWLIGWQSSDSRHLAVAFPVAGERLALLDPAGNYHSGSSWSLGSEPVEEAITNWFDNWNRPGIYINFVCSDTFYEEFDNTAAFFDWFYSIY